MFPAVQKSNQIVPKPNRVATNPNKSNQRLHRTKHGPCRRCRDRTPFQRTAGRVTRLPREDARWWLSATGIFLTLIGVAVAILSYFSFKRRDRIGSKARENMEASEKHAEEAQRYVEEIKAYRDEADSLIKRMNAEILNDDPDKASEVVENVQQNPDSSPIDRAVAAALSLQQQNRIEEAIENGALSPISQKEPTSIRLKHGLTSAISCLPRMWREGILQEQLLPITRRLS